MKEKVYIAQAHIPGQLAGGGLAPTAQEHPVPLLNQTPKKEKKNKPKKPKKTKRLVY